MFSESRLQLNVIPVKTPGHVAELLATIEAVPAAIEVPFVNETPGQTIILLTGVPALPTLKVPTTSRLAMGVWVPIPTFPPK